MKDTTTQSHASHITNDPFPARQGYKWTKVGVIPEDWEIQRLDAICSVYSGGTPSTARHDFYGGHIPWITSGDLNAQRITEVSNYLTQAGFDSSAAKMVESGDLVVALYGATAGVVAITEIEAAINQAVLAIKTNRCDSEYLFYHLASRRNQIVATYTQGGQPNLSGEIIRSLVIVIPPLAEQRAIAEALSDVDRLLNALSTLIAKKRMIKQAVMQQLLTGKTRLPGFSGAWKRKRLGDLAKIQKGSLITEKNVVPGTIPVIAGGQKPAYFHNIANRTGKTITVSASGAYAGFVALYNQPIFASDCSTISENSSFSIDFIYYYLVFNQHVIYNAQTGGAQPHIHPIDLIPLQVNLPPLREQHAIASVFSDIDAEIAALEQHQDKTRAIKQGMMQQLLTGRVRLVKPDASLKGAEN